MALEIDHVVVCVADLATAARQYLEDHGVDSIEGGRHIGHGTANRLIPLGDTYIELLSVVDPKEAKTSPLGNWAAHRAASPGADAVCLRTDQLDSLAESLSLQQMEMSRVTPDGVVLQWRLAGLKQALSTGVPFFITWDIPDDLHPGRADIDHPAGEVSLGGVTMSGDPEVLSRWTRGAEDLAITDGDPGVSFRLLAEPKTSQVTL